MKIIDYCLVPFQLLNCAFFEDYWLKKFWLKFCRLFSHPIIFHFSGVFQVQLFKTANLIIRKMPTKCVMQGFQLLCCTLFRGSSVITLDTQPPHLGQKQLFPRRNWKILPCTLEYKLKEEIWGLKAKVLTKEKHHLQKVTIKHI